MSDRTAHPLVVIFALAFVGCGVDRDRPARADGGAPATEETLAEPPMPPASPSLSPCPEGWRTAEVEGLELCEPWPMEGPTGCPAGEMKVPGDPVCQALGAPCPEGRWREGVTASGTIHHVSPDATGGDGTREAPHGQLSAALTAARPGDVVLLSGGVHEVETFVELPAGVRLVGACARETILESEHVAPGRALVALRAGEARMEGLSIRGSLMGIVAAGAGTTLELEGVRVDRATGIGVLALAGATVRGTDVHVVDLVPGSDGNGAGISVSDGGTMTLSRVRVERSPAAAAYARHTGSTLSLTRAALLDTQPGARPDLARGAWAEQGAALTLEETVVEGGVAAGVIAWNSDTLVTLADVVVRGVHPHGGGAAALVALDGASFVADRLRIHGFAGMGAYLDGSVLTVTDAVVHDLEAAENAGGLFAFRSAHVEGQRIAISNVRRVGLGLARGGSAELEDLRVAGTSDGGELGNAVLATATSSLTLRRAHLEHNGSGIVVGGADQTSTLVDVWIHGTRGEDDEIIHGTGLTVTLGAEAAIERVAVEDALSVGVVVAEPGSRLTGRDLRVSGTAHRRCPSGCGMDSYGSGLVLGFSGYAQLERVVLEDNALCGLRILTGAEADIREASIRRNPVGADLGTEGFDVSRISEGVEYVDNERNLEQTGLAAPRVTLPEI